MTDTNKKNILIIGAGDFQLPLVQRASLSYNVLLAAPVVSDVFKPYIADALLIDVRDKEGILAYAREKSICGVITDQTDIAVRSVAYVAENLGLPGIGYETGCLFTDKSLMRKRMAELGIKLLPNRTVSSFDEALAYYREIGGNVIIKPLDTQGSRGVQICRSEEELEAKYAEAARWSSNHNVLIERFATGREFLVEGLSLDYEFRNLCIGDTLYFDLPDAFAAKSRIFPTEADDGLRQRVLDLNTKIITGFGLKQGLTHSEYIMDGDDIYLIETAARGGGVFISSDLIHYSCGLDTEGFLLDIATGQRYRHGTAEGASPDQTAALCLLVPRFLYSGRKSCPRERRSRSTGAAVRTPQPAGQAPRRNRKQRRTYGQDFAAGADHQCP